MNDSIQPAYPLHYHAIQNDTSNAGFTMASDPLTCSLLRTLAAGKPAGNFLELGTGSGLSTSWILDGMDNNSSFTSIDNDARFLAIANQYLGSDKRLKLVEADGGDWLQQNLDKKFDYIFADTWHGKYLMLEETLQMLNPGALYIIDDMLPQPNWPDGHAAKATQLIAQLENRTDLFVTKMAWASGLMICTKK